MVGKVEREMSRTDRTVRRVRIEGSWGYVGIEDEGVVEFLKKYGRDESVMEVIVVALKGVVSSMGRYLVDEAKLKVQEAVGAAMERVSTEGVVGEQRLYEMLVETLPMREGYEVEMSSGQADSMVIRKSGFQDVRVECKAYGEQVGKGEVSKFRTDLELMGTHGIFVSLHSGIMGIGKKFHMEQMPNGKFAVYLGENGYDTETIHSMLMILYKLDKYEGDEGATLSVSSETMMRVQVYLGEVVLKMKTVVASLKSNITMLNEMSVDTVVQMLMGERDSYCSGDEEGCDDGCGEEGGDADDIGGGEAASAIGGVVAAAGW
jgi:hypothetical protein